MLYMSKDNILCCHHKSVHSCLVAIITLLYNFSQTGPKVQDLLLAHRQAGGTPHMLVLPTFSYSAPIIWSFLSYLIMGTVQYTNIGVCSAKEFCFEYILHNIQPSN
jgi:hypothetical protein